jgi:hypothetical protein
LLLVRPLLTVSSILPMRPLTASFAPAVAVFITTGTLLATAVATLAEAVAIAAVAVFLPVGARIASWSLGGSGLDGCLRRDIALKPPEESTEQA